MARFLEDFARLARGAALVAVKGIADRCCGDNNTACTLAMRSIGLHVSATQTCQTHTAACRFSTFPATVSEVTTTSDLRAVLSPRASHAAMCGNVCKPQHNRCALPRESLYVASLASASEALTACLHLAALISRTSAAAQGQQLAEAAQEAGKSAIRQHAPTAPGGPSEAMRAAQGVAQQAVQSLQQVAQRTQQSVEPHLREAAGRASARGATLQVNA